MDHSGPHHHSAFALGDWLPAILIACAGLLYGVLYFRLLNRKKRWKIWPLISFLVGIALLVIAAWPSVMHWGHTDMRGHMIQHLLIAMYAPIFLVLGAPVTLVLKASPPKTSRQVLRVFSSGFFGFIGHPIVAAVLNIGGMFLLYLTPLYNASLHNPVWHFLVHIHFLLAGYLFTWSLIGPDPAPRRPGFRLRLVVLFC